MHRLAYTTSETQHGENGSGDMECKPPHAEPRGPSRGQEDQSEAYNDSQDCIGLKAKATVQLLLRPLHTTCAVFR